MLRANVPNSDFRTILFFQGGGNVMTPNRSVGPSGPKTPGEGEYVAPPIP